MNPSTPSSRWQIPHRGAYNPSAAAQGTTHGSFALKDDVGGALTFSSPDTPGMLPPSDKTAWDFNPAPRGADRALTYVPASEVQALQDKLVQIGA